MFYFLYLSSNDMLRLFLGYWELHKIVAAVAQLAHLAKLVDFCAGQVELLDPFLL